MRTHRLIVAVGAALILGSGCGRPSPIDLQAAAALAGEWNLSVVIDPAPGAPPSKELRGTVALLPNRTGVEAADFPGVPLDLGVHDLALGSLTPGSGGRGATDVVASVIGDSVFLVIGSGTIRPIKLKGLYRADSMAGRWSAFQRAGPSFTGGFSLWRR